MKTLSLLLIAMTCYAGLVTGAPHQEGQSYVYLKIFDDHVEGRVEIRYSDLLVALGVPFSNPDGVDDAGAFVSAYSDSINSYIKHHLDLFVDGVSISYETTGTDILYLGLGDFIQIHFLLSGQIRSPKLIEVQFTGLFHADPNHRAFVVIEHFWGQGTFGNEASGALILTPDAPRQVVDLTDSSIWRGFVGMVRLGIWHIWKGLDHVLFLLALLLPAVLHRRDDRWFPVEEFRTALWNVFSIVSMFTVAHTVTLSLAALNVINLPTALVESVIAVSIALVALHNIYPVIPGRDWMIAFGFGLFHGFGFATVLGHLGVGTEHAVLSLLGFNLGVEIGQVAIILVAFPALYLARTRQWYPRFMVVGSWILIAVACVWLVERAMDVPVTRYLRHLIRPVTRRLGL